MSKDLCIGVIGAGRIGKLHTESIINNFRNVKVKWVSDIYVEHLTEWCKSFGIENLTKNYHEVLDDAEVDAVLVCSSTDTHAQICIDAAKRGKHIFCEKPIDLDVESIKKVEATVKEAGVKLQVGFNRRYDHNFSKVQKLVEEGRIGKPHIIKITSRDPEPPPIEYVKVSGGIFLDMAIHDFDMARFLCGSEVIEVCATGTVLVDEKIGEAGDVDTAVTVLKFANGAIGIIDNSRKAIYGYDQRIEVFGSEGCIKVENDYPNTATLTNINGIHGDKPQYFFLDRYKQSYVDEIKAFIDCIINDKEPEVSVIDGLNSVVIGLAAKKSLQDGVSVKI